MGKNTTSNPEAKKTRALWDVVHFKFVLLVCILLSFLHFCAVQFKLGLLICI